MKAVIYTRVSSTGDRQNTDRQVADLKAYAEYRQLEVTSIFEEKISGAKKNSERPVLVEALDYCEANSIDILLVSELSRLGRNAFEVLEVVKKLVDNKINLFMQKEQFTLLDENKQPSTFAAVMIATLSTCAQLERENIKFRLNSGRAQYIAKGGKLEVVGDITNNIKEAMRGNSDDWEADFSGAFFSSKKMINELVVVLFISLLLMYFILTSQFGSFLQPLIVLAEIPIDVGFALVIMSMLGISLNLMSAIGIVVSCGIIINDSILKLDMINVLRNEGTPLLEAIHTAGSRRLRSIVMTSLTTILAMVPLLFTHDFGSELQKPLAIAMIATMTVGTLVSLFVIPLIYWFIYRNKPITVQ